MKSSASASIPLTWIDRSRGLPSNQIHRLAQDGFGRLWMAGPSGLAFYDGSRVRSLNISHGLRCAGLRSVAVGPNDLVWIGTDLGIEAVDHHQSPVAGLETLPWDFGLVDCIVAGAHEAWLGTPQGLVQLLWDTPMGAVRLGAHFEIGYVRDLVQLDANTVVAVSAQQGLFMVSGGRHQVSWQPDVPEPGSVRRLHAAPDGRLLVASPSGVRLLDRGGVLLARSDAPGGAMLAGPMAMDGAQVWLGSGAQLVGFELAEGALVETSRQTLASPLNDLMLDQAGNLWVATDTAGLGRLSCLRTALARVDVGGGAAVYVVKPLADGEWLVGGAGFEARIRIDAQGRTTELSRASLPTTVWDVALDLPGNRRWLATHGGLYCAQGMGPPLPCDFGIALLTVPCRVLILRGNELWLGTLTGLLKLVNGVVHEITGLDGVSLGYVYAMHVDSAGRLWVGTLGRGLWRETANGLEPLTGAALSPVTNNFVVAVAPNPERALVVQNDRIILLDADAAPKELARLPPNAGWAGQWLDAHRVAMGSSDGLFVFDTRSATVETRINAVWSANEWEFTNNRSLARGDDGRLYCGTNGGLFTVDLAALAPLAHAPPAVALSELVWQGATPQLVDGWHVVDPGKWSLQAWVCSPWLVDEVHVSFQFRLAGFESEWSAPNGIPMVAYSSLPPGRYLLQARPFAPLTGEGAVVTLLQVQVRHRPLAGLMSLVVSAYDRSFGLALRNRRLLARHSELEAEVAARRQAEEALQRHRAGLEDQVAARTRELVAAVDEAQRANRAKSEFLSRMSHELRTPLNAILGFSQLMAIEGGLDARHRGFVDETVKAGRHLLALISEVLDLAQIEAGRLELKTEPLALDALVADCVAMVEPAARRRHLQVQVGPESGLRVQADRRRLQQVLLNLLTNVVKYNREGGRIDIATSAPSPHRVRITVADTGPGISDDRMAELFTPFNRLGAEFSNVEGTGIGLAISRQIMLLMGGLVGVASEPGRGSRFWLEWPDAFEPVAAALLDGAPAAMAGASGPARASGGSVLYVEDNAANRVLVSQIVSRHAGVYLRMAATAAQGLSLAQTHDFDLLLIDLQLPDMDGISLLKRLRHDPTRRRTPALAVSAFAMSDDHDRSLAAGFAEHVNKHIDIAGFDALLVRYLGGDAGRRPQADPVSHSEMQASRPSDGPGGPGSGDKRTRRPTT